MNKKSLPVFSALLVLCFLFGSFGTATAAPLHDDPVVEVISGGAALETKIIPLEQLPGVTVSDAGLSQPEFSSSGMSQFGGDGVRVKGLLGSVASVCFTAKPPSAGWTNTVHRWTGFTWEEIPTVVSTTEGGINPKACATIYYNSTYALLIGYVEPDGKNAAADQTDCGYDTSEWTGGYYDEYYFYAQFPPDFPEDVDATYEVLGTTGVIDLEGEYTDTASTYYADWDDVVYADFENYPFTFDGEWTATLLINAAGCSKTIVITDSDYYGE